MKLKTLLFLAAISFNAFAGEDIYLKGNYTRPVYSSMVRSLIAQ